MTTTVCRDNTGPHKPIFLVMLVNQVSSEGSRLTLSPLSVCLSLCLSTTPASSTGADSQQDKRYPTAAIANPTLADPAVRSKCYTRGTLSRAHRSISQTEESGRLLGNCNFLLLGSKIISQGGLLSLGALASRLQPFLYNGCRLPVRTKALAFFVLCLGTSQLCH